MLRHASLATLMLKDGGVHGGVNVRSNGGMPGMESVKERFRDEAVGGVRLGVDSSCKRVVSDSRSECKAVSRSATYIR